MLIFPFVSLLISPDNVIIFFMKYLLKDVLKTQNRDNLIEKNDRILVGLSGGKDSFVTLHLLSLLRDLPHFSFSLTALKVLSPFEQEDSEPIEHLKSKCAKLNTPLIIHPVTEEQLNLDQGKRKFSLCYCCARVRRKILFQTGIDNNFNKLALGHNQNDAAESLLMNMAFHQESWTFASKTLFFDKITLIRPLYDISDKSIRYYAEKYDYIQQFPCCPHFKESKRNPSREIVDQISKLHQDALKNFTQSALTSFIPVKDHPVEDS